MGDLPDVNVWVALSIVQHPQHKSAMAYWRRDAATMLYFCRTTGLGLIRVSAQYLAADGRPAIVDSAWGMYQQWQSHNSVALLQEPSPTEQQLSAFVANGLVTARTLTDAYLAAFAISGDLRLVSFDGDFRRFPGLNWLKL